MFSDRIAVSADADSIMPTITPKYLAPYQNKLRDSFETIIGTAIKPFTKTRPGGSLGNLLTAAVWQYILVQNTHTVIKDSPIIFLTNYGGLRLNSIEAGKITIGKIVELLPFENTLVKMLVPGKVIADILQKQKGYGGWPMRYNEHPAFQSYNQLKKHPAVIFYTNNYLAEGGDHCEALRAYNQNDTHILLRDILCDYIKKQGTVEPNDSVYAIP